MRTTRDRIRHAILFEAIGLALVIPLGSTLFGLPASDMGVIGVGSALVAMAWNYVYNLGFDRALQRLTGHTRKGLLLRVGHAVLFEAGLLVILLPPIAWYLGISLVEALVMDLAIAGFYVAYAFLFNLAYDWAFPLRSWGAVAAEPTA
ncbi:PACE efflux transporter [Methylobacterium sp. WL103]|uniref:PACE efflux transporter n=1 Tax=Methylobacterium sp. WL103 TaxID=2603891 RepID=UPI0011CA1246|nr:PACE efflux transporter [Methylobacterium sp. WL103]TXM94587.1 PACE efflux transporter [Methylobacterium sp. WL103]